MTRASIAGAAVASALGLLAIVAGHRAFERRANRVAAESPVNAPSAVPTAADLQPVPGSAQGFLYGRITTVDGAKYVGRLRWGGDQEAFWNDSFNGFKPGNRWLVDVPPERLLEERPIEIFGLRIATRKRRIDTGRPLMVPFGEIERLEALGRRVRVTLKSGTVYTVDRYEASDFDDGVRVWDGQRGVVDLDSSRIRTIELLPTPPLAVAPVRLHGTVRTLRGEEFMGFVQWNRQKRLGTDELDGRTADGAHRLRFDTIRSIARGARGGSLVTLLDGQEIALSAGADADDGNRGVQVDDRRLGRVVVPWEQFERVDFDHPAEGEPAGSGPAYGDFPPGRPLTGSVTTRERRRLAGRLVYDLDECETSETLDAPSQGVDHIIPFDLVASIALPGRDERGARHARVTLQGGEELQFERAGDLGDRNAGLLVFVDGGERAEYVPWSEVERIDFDRPPGPPATEPAPGAG